MPNWCALVSVVWLCGLPAAAQFSGRISGSVLDASGAIIAGASVQLYLAGGAKPVLTAKTSSDGLYNLLGVRPAEYQLRVEAQGFVTATVRDIVVDAAREISVPPI